MIQEESVAVIRLDKIDHVALGTTRTAVPLREAVLVPLQPSIDDFLWGTLAEGLDQNGMGTLSQFQCRQVVEGHVSIEVRDVRHVLNVERHMGKQFPHSHVIDHGGTAMQL